MSGPERALRRLQYETVDWCRSVRGIYSQRTHAACRTAQHDPEVWTSRTLECWFCDRTYTVDESPWTIDGEDGPAYRCPDCGSANSLEDEHVD